MNYGWIPPSERNELQAEAHDDALRRMPKFAILGDPGYSIPINTKVLLTDSWKSTAVVAKLGMPFTGWHQYTGSCVGVGFGNAAFTLAATDVLLRGDREDLIIPFWPMNYGRSRLLMGERGPGEGSLGSCIARSAKEDGLVSWTFPGLPKYFTPDGFTLGDNGDNSSRTEYQWSDGTRIPANVIEEGHKHLVRTAAPLQSVDDLVAANMNGYPVAGACMHFCPPNGAKITNDVLLGNYSGTGGHQMSYHGVYNHPELGLLIWNQNTWGLNAYGSTPDPAGGPRGGCWQKAADVDRMMKSRDAEFYAFSQYDGYPAQNLTDFW